MSSPLETPLFPSPKAGTSGSRSVSDKIGPSSEVHDESRSRSRSGQRLSSESGRSRSRSRRHGKHRHRRRSNSSSRGYIHPKDLAELVGKLVQENVADAFARQNGSQTQESVSVTQVDQVLQDLRKGQKEREIEKTVESLSTPGAQSQYKVVAGIGLRISGAIEKLDEIGLSFDDPDNVLYKSLAAVRADLATAQKLSEDRCDLILRADEDPQNGWKALTRYEKVVGASSKSSNPEREKVFAECLKKVQEDNKKKTKVTGSQFARSL